MTYERQFIVGKTYLRRDGKLVKIIAENTKYGPHYTCVQGDDGEDGILVVEANDVGWRYDRESDAGRCTASAMSDPKNLVVDSEKAANIILDMEGKIEVLRTALQNISNGIPAPDKFALKCLELLKGTEQ